MKSVAMRVTYRIDQMEPAGRIQGLGTADRLLARGKEEPKVTVAVPVLRMDPWQAVMKALPSRTRRLDPVVLLVECLECDAVIYDRESYSNKQMPGSHAWKMHREG